MSQVDPPADPLALTRFLTALSHSPQLLKAYSEDAENAEKVARTWGVKGPKLDALLSGNLESIQTLVSAEVKEYGAEATVGWWIMVEEQEQDSSRGLPAWWIRHF